MNLFAEMEDAIKAVLRSMPELAEADMARVIVEPPRDPSHGDMATNAAMVLAKAAGVNPRELAEKICPALLILNKSPRPLLPGRALSISGCNRLAGKVLCRPYCRPVRIMVSLTRRMRQLMSNMFQPIRPAQCMSAMRAVRVFSVMAGAVAGARRIRGNARVLYQ